MIRYTPLLFAFLLLSACDQTVVTTPVIASMKIADQINVVTPTESVNVNIGSASSLLRAFNGADTDYSNDPTNFYVHLDALRPIETANMILCYMGQLGVSDPSTLNTGDYLALVDPSKCESGNNGNQGTGESSSGVVVRRNRFIVNNSRADNDSPQIVKIWLEQEEEGHRGEIRGEMVITSGATDSPPFGLFTFNWWQVADGIEGPLGKGSLVVFDKEPGTLNDLTNGNVGLTLYEEETQDFSQHKRRNGLSPSDVFGDTVKTVKAASAVMTTDESGNVLDGRALTQVKVIDSLTGLDFDIDARLEELNAQPEDFDSEQFSRTFAISYNADNLLIQEASLYSQLPYVLDAADNDLGTCLSRHDFDEAIWCYDLYDVDTGERLALNSSFPFTLQKDACGEKALYGNLGYYGAWFEGDNKGIDGCALESGDVVTKQNFEGDAQEEYEILRSSGHIVKNTIQQLALASVKGIQLDMHQLPTDSDMFRDPNLGEGDDPYEALKTLKNSNSYQIDGWVVHYLTTLDGVEADGFYIYGFTSHANGGPSITLLSNLEIDGLDALYDVTPRSIDGQQIWFYSMQLGGSVRFTKGQSFVTYTKQEIVDPTDALFAGSDTAASLLCLFGCLKADITEEDQNTHDGPFLSPESYSGSGDLRYVPYQISRTDMNLKNMNGDDITLAEGQNSVGMYAWGISMSPMVTQSQLDELTNWWEIWNTNGAVFYQWQTGSNSWNRTISARREGTNQFVSFDKPIQFSYTHTTANDRAGDDTYDGQTFLLSYQGRCQLHGIPSKNVGHGNHSRYYPQFAIADGAVLGQDSEYVVRALRGEQKPKPVEDECALMTVADPAVAIPDASAGDPGNADETMPEVTVAKFDNGELIE